MVDASQREAVRAGSETGVPSRITHHASRIRRSGFTMIEIALCLAIIGFALVSILLVLPTGMHTQRDTRQETIIGQDASMLLEAVRNGARGMDDLTNYVYSIANYWTEYTPQGTPIQSGVNTNSYHWASQNIPATSIGADLPAMHLTNGLRIIGLLSTPEYVNVAGDPLATPFGQVYFSNHIVAYVRSFSGLAAEKPPQDSPLMEGATFSYRLLCVNAPVALDTNLPVAGYNKQLAGNLRELRMLFLWPQLPNGDVGQFRQNFRTMIAGRLVRATNYTNYFPGTDSSRFSLYFYAP